MSEDKVVKYIAEPVSSEEEEAEAEAAPGEGERKEEAETSLVQQERIVIEKDMEGNWHIVEPESAGVKTSVLEGTLRQLSTLKADTFPDSIISPEACGLAPPNGFVEVHLNDGAIYTLLIGDTEEKNRRYVKKADDDTIVLIYSSRVESLARKLDTLREEKKEEEPQEETG